MNIRTIKTWYGSRFAIVGADGFAIDLDNNSVAIYPNTKEGLAQAREKLAELKGQLLMDFVWFLVKVFFAYALINVSFFIFSLLIMFLIIWLYEKSKSQY